MALGRRCFCKGVLAPRSEEELSPLSAGVLAWEEMPIVGAEVAPDGEAEVSTPYAVGSGYVIARACEEGANGTAGSG